MCVEKITRVVKFLSYCWEFEIRNSVFHVGNSTLNHFLNSFCNEDWNRRELQDWKKN